MQIPLRYRFVRSLINARDWFSAQVIFLSLKLLRLVPMETAAGFFERLARWLGPKLKRHQVAMDNLAIAFPEKSLEEHEQIASDSWAQMARSILEFALERTRSAVDLEAVGAGETSRSYGKSVGARGDRAVAFE